MEGKLKKEIALLLHDFLIFDFDSECLKDFYTTDTI